MRSRGSTLCAAAVVVAAVAVAATARAGAPLVGEKPFLWQCEQIGREDAKDRCYVRLLLEDVDRSGDPADELPRIDRRARLAGTSLYARCHMLMHVVGRRFALEHHVTLETLQRYVPRSNDPGCSAGFGMGLVMALGPQIMATGGRSALRTCDRLPTQYRVYTCVHSLGHALMRGYHEVLPLAVDACRKLGPRAAPDCAQGAFHDYWIAIRGADDATRPRNVVRSARVLCARYPRFALGCWYRHFVEESPGPVLQGAVSLERLCVGLRGAQRAGCIAAGSLDMANDPFSQLRVCARLGALDAVSCLRGAVIQATAGQPRRQLALIGDCRLLPLGGRRGCYAWLGRTLNLVTNGRFRTRGCARLATPFERAACTAGATAYARPVVTFS